MLWLVKATARYANYAIFLTCLTCLHFFTWLTCPLSLRALCAFIFFLHALYALLACLHFFTCLRLLMYILKKLTQTKELTYDFSSLLLLNSLIYQHLSGIFTSIKLVSYSAWFFLFFVTKNLNPSRPDPGQRENINLNFYFHTSLWCLKRFYEGL